MHLSYTEKRKLSYTLFAISGRLTLSASHTRTVLSKDDVARRLEVAAKRTSVMISECSSSRFRIFCVSTSHKIACREA